MTDQEAIQQSIDLREQLSRLEHDQWSGWWDYQVEKSTINPDGSMTIPAWAVERWTRQAKTPYAELSEQEKQSDRIEADRVLILVNAALVPEANPSTYAAEGTP